MLKNEGIQIKPTILPSADDPVLNTTAAPPAVPNETLIARARRLLGEIDKQMSASLLELESSEPTTRALIVATLARRLQHSTDDLANATAQISNEDRVALQALANKTAESVVVVATWIESRAPNTTMRRAVAPIFSGLDRALTQLGLETIGKRPIARLKGDEKREADDERARADREASSLRNEISAELALRKVAHESRRAGTR